MRRPHILVTSVCNAIAVAVGELLTLGSVSARRRLLALLTTSQVLDACCVPRPAVHRADREHLRGSSSHNPSPDHRLRIDLVVQSQPSRVVSLSKLLVVAQDCHLGDLAGLESFQALLRFCELGRDHDQEELDCKDGPEEDQQDKVEEHHWRVRVLDEIHDVVPALHGHHLEDRHDRRSDTVEVDDASGIILSEQQTLVIQRADCSSTTQGAGGWRSIPGHAIVDVVTQTSQHPSVQLHTQNPENEEDEAA
mmetsp:Transcript_18962/g.45565  ORF Transcript_18962/g.45565 Transcript_18962/m.45565 type:complete len:251 (-) Transcript_18962:381-1133(-)